MIRHIKLELRAQQSQHTTKVVFQTPHFERTEPPHFEQTESRASGGSNRTHNAHAATQTTSHMNAELHTVAAQVSLCVRSGGYFC